MGSWVQYVGTVRLFSNGVGRYVGKLFELNIPDFSHIAPLFVCSGKRQLKLMLNVCIEIADLQTSDFKVSSGYE